MPPDERPRNIDEVRGSAGDIGGWAGTAEIAGVITPGILVVGSNVKKTHHRSAPLNNPRLSGHYPSTADEFQARDYAEFRVQVAPPNLYS
jgi:hypothetical protein